MLVRSLMLVLLAGAVPPLVDGPADVARIREATKELRAKPELKNDEALVSEWLDTLWKAADEAKDDKEAWSALILAQEVAEQCTTTKAKEWRAKVRTRALDRFADDAERMLALLRISGGEETRAAVLAVTKNASVKAAAHWADANSLMAKQKKEKLSEAEQKKLDGIFKLFQGELGSALDARGRKWGDVVAGKLRAMNELVIGKVAPQIEGTDLDGQPFKLSDYRGKIVVLDFWGNW